jgi:hypothetical protein
METIKVELEVAKESYELASGLTKFIADVKAALADGWQPGTDLPLILSASISDLAPAVAGAEKVGGEVTTDPEKFADAMYCGLKGLPWLFVKKAVPVPEAPAV